VSTILKTSERKLEDPEHFVIVILILFKLVVVATSASAYKGAQSALSQCVRQHELTLGRSNARLDAL
jgi:hypothetical protein